MCAQVLETGCIGKCRAAGNADADTHSLAHAFTTTANSERQCAVGGEGLSVSPFGRTP